ncbi:hypothetical protein GM160_05575 [Guyparkeria halophila]|uniref:Uncharacterized protein n=1 Tax=Guyparkeria halophila TaxID=47960 RepID=A0A6I6D0H5_9GAMM|nr:hypothetical protein [Guyparkeria halophila]QGT78408.1 hypothetical protein GM160_05575 [Guyparkeria halophila]
MDYRAVLERVKRTESGQIATAKTTETHVSGVSVVAETAHSREREGFRGFCSGGNGVFSFNETPISRTPRAALAAQADAAGHAAANESPRALSPIEKAGIARLCRQQYGADDAAISATIEDCEGCPAMREYHLALDRLTTTHRTAGAT